MKPLHPTTHSARHRFVALMAAFVAIVASTLVVTSTAEAGPPDRNERQRASISERAPLSCAHENQLELDTAQTTTSSNYRSWFGGNNAIDGSASTQWISEAWQQSPWITVAARTPSTVTDYAITFANGSALTSRSPADWQVAGSNDGVTWTPVDRRYDQLEWAGSETRTFTVTEPGSYQWYRLEVIEDHDPRAMVVVASIAELALFAGCEIDVPAVTSCTLEHAIDIPQASAASSGNYSAAYQPNSAFDFNPSTRWLSETWQSEPWIQAEIAGPAKRVTAYAIQFTNGSSLTTRAPSWWTLSGSDDGANWSLIDERELETNWAGSETRSFTVAEPAEYTYLRLTVWEDNDDRAAVVVASISELRFFDACEMDPSFGVGLDGLGRGVLGPSVRMGD